ncbi:PEP-CTERM sorting domain-containing protein [Nitrosomonas sp. Nm166]|uniref:PEP-CTERM sorting domain-containing protein n=1 Tax=Nitrosomonas sp. Nm166 TaxID=1881054 RepID=UPI0008EA8BFB|nr:PEP-CTERM sorting domain-containing protein [Nitrosomonas sp. Nm166]SFD91271.1 PEP-CTERM protein-sorting domain-containing protein [Nitrosomonas sp. Nm166]
MKKLFKILVLLSLALSINIVMASTTYTFTSAPASDLISEDSGTYSSSISYTPLWNPGTVSSATLTLFLSDDVSTTLKGFNAIDIPREWAQVTNISDGSSSLGSQAAVEVEQTNPLFDPANTFPFNTTFTGSDGFESPLTANPITVPALVGAAAGIGLIQPSVAGYNFDVTSLINVSAPSGNVFFDLVALNLYDPASLPLAFTSAAAIFGFNTALTQSTYEDFLFTGAQLTISAVPEPSMYMLLVLGLFGMFVMRKWLYYNK